MSWMRINNRRTPRRGTSLALRLTAWYSTASFVLVAIATGFLYLGVASNMRRLSEQLLADELDVCRALMRERSNDVHALREEAEIDSAIRKYQRFYVRVLDEHGQVLATTPGMNEELSAARLTAEESRRPGYIFWLESPTGTPYRAVTAKVPRDLAGRDLWTLQVAVDLSEEVEVLRHHRVWVFAVLGAAAIFCPWVGFVIARRGTRPLRQVADTARQVSSRTLSERIQTDGYPEEVAALADTFNEMLQRLEESFARLSRFSADIAHELRTPVNNIRGESEVALARVRSAEEYREVLGSCLEESVRLSELIQSLLFLSRAESPGQDLKRLPQDIQKLLADVRDYYDAVAAESGVRLLVNCEGGLVGEVDVALFQRALGNLVSNALANTPRDGTIRLSGRWDKSGVVITVADTGHGISAESLPHVFDRFYRADPARARNSGGTGLGLAIVRQIVSWHGGDVQIASEPGGGTTVSVTLPAVVQPVSVTSVVAQKTY